MLKYAIEIALQRYPKENIDIVRNESTDLLDIMYCSHNNSFPIIDGVIWADQNNYKKVVKLCDKYGIGLVW